MAACRVEQSFNTIEHRPEYKTADNACERGLGMWWEHSLNDRNEMGLGVFCR